MTVSKVGRRYQPVRRWPSYHRRQLPRNPCIESGDVSAGRSGTNDPGNTVNVPANPIHHSAFNAESRRLAVVACSPAPQSEAPVAMASDAVLHRPAAPTLPHLSSRVLCVPCAHQPRQEPVMLHVRIRGGGDRRWSFLLRLSYCHCASGSSLNPRQCFGRIAPKCLRSKVTTMSLPSRSASATTDASTPPSGKFR